MIRIRRLAGAAWVAATCLALVSCGRSTAPETVVGRYVLQSVADRSLPVTILRSPELDVAILGGSVTLDSDSGFVDERRYRMTEVGMEPVTQIDTLTGTYSVSGNAVSLVASDGSQYGMIWTGRALAWYVEGFTYRFWK